MFRLPKCAKCGGTRMKKLDGAKIDAMPGIKYMVCDACGSTKAITKRQRKEKLS